MRTNVVDRPGQARLRIVMVMLPLMGLVIGGSCAVFLGHPTLLIDIRFVVVLEVLSFSSLVCLMSGQPRRIIGTPKGVEKRLAFKTTALFLVMMTGSANFALALGASGLVVVVWFVVDRHIIEVS